MSPRMPPRCVGSLHSCTVSRRAALQACSTCAWSMHEGVSYAEPVKEASRIGQGIFFFRIAGVTRQVSKEAGLPRRAYSARPHTSPRVDAG
jgi:hypothetical protein